MGLLKKAWVSAPAILAGAIFVYYKKKSRKPRHRDYDVADVWFT